MTPAASPPGGRNAHLGATLCSDPCSGYLDRGATTLGLAFWTPVNVVCCTILARGAATVQMPGMMGLWFREIGDRAVPAGEGRPPLFTIE
ncbi:hypothetical protein RIB2604_01701450 [Aspergillus luchuensis]|uniref:Uncharacterized protein n=1 Tax=Aspergillus kawachii TaxID=1069201 RepID=A0A146FBI2_ASPKA|nr:hypothetical protein RIB2604_01701450 [Aspergillus luchuensis]